MTEKEQILTENINEYLEQGQRAFNSKKYNSAVTLFFKAIGATADLIILKKEGIMPTSHSSRFRTLQEKYPEIYETLDKDFPFYQDSYSKKMTKESAEVLREDAKRLKKLCEGTKER